MKKLVVIILALTILTANAGAANYALIQTQTGQLIEGAGETEPIKSGVLAKLMTALLTGESIESGELTVDKLITVSSAVSDTKAPVVWLMPGERITVRELLKGLLTGNANDCAAALACAVSGNTEKFVKRMNEKAAELGMNNTHFNDCINDCDTTAYDMALLSMNVSKHECLKEYMITFMDYIRDGNTMLVNNNKLVKNYKGISGQLAGRTDESGWCISLSAKRDEGEYACIVLGEEDEDEMFARARGLLDNGFANYITFTPSIEKEKFAPIPVKKGVAKLVQIEPSDIQSVIIKKGEEQSIDYEIVTEQLLEAPVRENQVVGKLNIRKNGEIILTSDIIASQKVEKMSVLKYFMLFVWAFFK